MTFKSISTSGTGSSRASSKFGLDEEDKNNVLVYKYRYGTKSLEVKTQAELAKELDSDPNFDYLRVTRKPIPRGNSRLDILTEDLMLPDDLEKYKEKPTLKSSVANVGLPRTASWKHLLFGSFENLYIVSKGLSPTPDNSQPNSPESSQHISPQGTFPAHHPHPLQKRDS